MAGVEGGPAPKERCLPFLGRQCGRGWGVGWGGGGGHKLLLRALDRHGKLQRTLNWNRNEKMQMNRHRVGQEGEEETKIRGLRSQRFKKEERVDRRVDRRERATPLGPGEVPLLHIRPHQ